MTMLASSNLRILMCEPDYYGVEYSINPWMSLANPVSGKKSWVQWNRLRELILRSGAQVEYIPQRPGLPDMVFTANAGLVYRGTCVLARFRYPERQGEELFFDRFFRKQFDVVRLPDNMKFEGAGDALLDGDTLFAGFGFRTDRHVYDTIAGVLGIRDVIYCELANPYFYHLDTCLCPLGGGAALCYLPALTEASQRAIESRVEVLRVPDEEAYRFACNAVVLGSKVVLPQGCPRTEELLQRRGFAPQACDMSEFIKAGGACKCLTLALGPAGTSGSAGGEARRQRGAAPAPLPADGFPAVLPPTEIRTLGGQP